MYEQYWGLREKPFRKTPDPRYLFLNEAYEEALERLEFAVEEMELALLTGEVGSGKTLLTRALVDRIGERYEV
ncbi:MAG: ATPase, partial [Kofleriaceae bacterium]